MLARRFVLASSLLGGLALYSCKSSGKHDVDSAHATAGPVDREVFLLPPGYRGPVLVLYDQPGGVKPSAANGKASYLVPPEGVVRSSLQEPALGTEVTTSFSDSPEAALRTFPTCDEMRLNRSASAPLATCWIDQTLGTGVPRYVSFIVTDWVSIPRHYNQATSLIDSLLFRGKLHGEPKWIEPKSAPPQRKTGTL